MTDAEYLFREHSQESKRNARGAYNKKGGSRSKSCRLPSDYLSQSQKKKLNGELITVNMNEKISWEKFKRLPKDLKKEYILNLRENHKGRAMDIAEMFGIAYNSYSSYMNRVLPEVKITGSGARSVAPEWIKFMNSDAKETLKETESEEGNYASGDAKNLQVIGVMDTIEPEEVKPKKAASLNLEQGCLIFQGEPSLAFGKALMVFGTGKNYEIIINFKEVKDADAETGV